MKKLACLAVVALLALPVSAQSWEIGNPVNPNTLIGGYEWPDAGQGSFAYVRLNAVPGAPGRGLFGLQWAGPVLLDTLTIKFDTAGRDIPSTLLLYTSTAPGAVPMEISLDMTDVMNGNAIVIKLADYAVDTKSLLVQNSYLMIAVKDVYASQYGFGLRQLTAVATAAGPVDVNANSKILPTVVGGYPGETFPAVMTDDDPASVRYVAGEWGAIDYSDGKVESYWKTDETGERSVTVDYGNNRPEFIGTIGLGFAGDWYYRDCPKWVIVTDGVISETIDIFAAACQYGRYELTTGFANPKSLTLIFPEWTGTAEDADNWWLNSGGPSYFGLSEFQAFASVIPEPMTMSLLALGGLALLRRRRK